MASFFMHDSFIEYLVAEKRFSEHTCKAYKKDLDQFAEFSGAITQKDLQEIDARLIRGWIVSIMENGLAPQSANRKLSTLRTYFKWLRRSNLIKSNPMQLITGPKNVKRLPSFAQKQELEPVRIDILFSGDFEGIRDRLMFEFFYQTGIRLSELIGLSVSDVAQDKIKVLGKRNKERLIPITPELRELVNKYLALRHDLELKNDAFFVLKTDKKLYPKFVYRRINSYLSSATDMKKKSPHVLRHTFATHMLNNGAGLEVLKELLGHANLSATQIYTHNSFAELTSIYSQSHPRGQQK